jgi:ATP-binding cassette, subfamily B, multidrug efflux pump
MKHLYKLLKYVKPYWKEAVAALILLTLMVLMDLSIPRLIEQIIDLGIKQNNMTVVLQTSFLMIGISIMDTIVAVANNIYSIRVGEGMARDLREALFIKIQSFSYGDLDAFTTGNLMVRLSSDSGAVQRVFQVSLRIGTRAPLMMIGSLILMFNTSPTLAMSMIPLLLVTSIVIIVFSIYMEPLFRIVQQKLDRLNTVLQENISGVRLVKAFVRADYEGGRFEASNQDLTVNTTRVMQWMSTMTPLLTIFINIGMVIIIWFGGLQAINGSMSIGQLVAFTNYLLTTMGPLIMMTQLANTWASGMASAKRINEVLDVVPEIQQAENAIILPASAAARVEFKNVSFRYKGSNNVTVLENINLLAEPGQTVAILGATGAGKTSLINLIPRYYDVDAGQVCIDGVDIRQIQEESLLAQIGIVPQESVLFSGTVRDNICYGRPDASDEEVFAAARAAQAHDFIQSFADGYDTHVQERGVNLSGGQKQRLAIARALITRPKILILDDSTSSVDVETETKIQTALDQIMKGRTCFVVAQRISTVLNANKIVVLDKGRIAAEGNHAELIVSSPIYQEIFESQLGGGLQLEAVGGLVTEEVQP